MKLAEGLKALILERRVLEKQLKIERELKILHEHGLNCNVGADRADKVLKGV